MKKLHIIAKLHDLNKNQVQLKYFYGNFLFLWEFSFFYGNFLFFNGNFLNTLGNRVGEGRC